MLKKTFCQTTSPCTHRSKFCGCYTLIPILFHMLDALMLDNVHEKNKVWGNSLSHFFGSILVGSSFSEFLLLKFKINFCWLVGRCFCTGLLAWRAAFLVVVIMLFSFNLCGRCNGYFSVCECILKLGECIFLVKLWRGLMKGWHFKIRFWGQNYVSRWGR